MKNILKTTFSFIVVLSLVLNTSIVFAQATPIENEGVVGIEGAPTQPAIPEIPEVTSVVISNITAVGQSYVNPSNMELISGDTIKFTVTFTEPITGSGRIEFDMNNTRSCSFHVTGIASSEATCEYIITDYDYTTGVIENTHVYAETYIGEDSSHASEDSAHAFEITERSNIADTDTPLNRSAIDLGAFTLTSNISVAVGGLSVAHEGNDQSLPYYTNNDLLKWVTTANTTSSEYYRFNLEYTDLQGVSTVLSQTPWEIATCSHGDNEVPIEYGNIATNPVTITEGTYILSSAVCTTGAVPVECVGTANTQELSTIIDGKSLMADYTASTGETCRAEQVSSSPVVYDITNPYNVEVLHANYDSSSNEISIAWSHAGNDMSTPENTNSDLSGIDHYNVWCSQRAVGSTGAYSPCPVTPQYNLSNKDSISKNLMADLSAIGTVGRVDIGEAEDWRINTYASLGTVPVVLNLAVIESSGEDNISVTPDFRTLTINPEEEEEAVPTIGEIEDNIISNYPYSGSYSYDNADITKEYCFRVETVDKANNVSSYEDVCVTGDNMAPPVVEDLIVVKRWSNWSCKWYR